MSLFCLSEASFPFLPLKLRANKVFESESMDRQSADVYRLTNLQDETDVATRSARAATNWLIQAISCDVSFQIGGQTVVTGRLRDCDRLLRSFNRVAESTGLRIGHRQRSQNNWVTPSWSLRDAGCQLDRPFAVSPGRIGRCCQDPRKITSSIQVLWITRETLLEMNDGVRFVALLQVG